MSFVNESPSRDLNLRDYLRIFRRRKWAIALTIALTTALAGGISALQSPVYQGTTKVLLQPELAQTLFNANTGQRNDPARAVDTELEIVKSQPVRDLVRRSFPNAPKVTATPVAQTDVIAVHARHRSATVAAKLADAYASAYIEFRRAGVVDSLLAAGREIQKRLGEQRGRLDEVQTELAAADVSADQRRADDLRAERDALIQQEALFRQRLDQLQVETSLRDGGARIVAAAATPKAPVSPQPVRNLLVGLLIGLLLGAAVAFLREQLDDSVKAKEDVERAVPGLPVLALIPVIDSNRERGLRSVVSIGSPGSSAAEAYRTLRTSIQFMGLDRPLRTLQVTSAAAREGKTTTVVNLAIALARAGQRVTLVDCDLRQPRVHEELGLNGEIGFTSVLVGSSSLESALQAVPGEDLLTVLTAGPKPPNPSELLSGRRAADVLNALEARSDIVLIDSPPVLPVTDAVVVAGRVDATLLVAMAGKTTRHALSRAREILANIEGPVVGLVLNAISAEDSYGYGYRYGYYYTRGVEQPPNGEEHPGRARTKPGDALGESL